MGGRVPGMVQEALPMVYRSGTTICTSAAAQSEDVRPDAAEPRMPSLWQMQSCTLLH